MKRAFFYSLGLLFISLSVKAQIYTPYGQLQGSSGYPGANGGNLGIGISTPLARLHINAEAINTTNVYSPPLAIAINSTRVQSTNGLVQDYFKVFTLKQRAINEYGNLLAGSNIETFSIYGNGSIESLGYFRASSFRAGSLSLGNSVLSFSLNGLSSGIRFTPSHKLILGELDFYSANLNPQGAYSVFVTGGLIAEELAVKLSADWPDYVFAPDYYLMPLPHLEGFLLEHQHLPGFQSAQEVEVQDLGANQIKLLEKVEELTLYIIDLNKQLQAAQAEIEELKKRSDG